jgi:hypothetical protein
VNLKKNAFFPLFF